MFRTFTVALAISLAAVAAAQTVKDLKGTPDRTVTEPAGARTQWNGSAPSPKDTPAEKAPSPAKDGAANGPDCEVRRADTDTGFIVVCVERGAD